MIPLSHLSFVQGGQVKCRPKKKVTIKVHVYHSVVAVWTVCVFVGGTKAVRHDRNFCNFFNLINFTASNKA